MTTAVTWLGHATALIESGDARLLTDPVLRKVVGHLWRHADTPPIPERLDAILLSHAHRDHFDVRTLAQIPKDVPVVVPAGIDRVVTRLGRPVIEVPVGESVTIAGTTVNVFPVDHDERRAPWSKLGAASGFLVGDEERVWFPGDTDLHPNMDELSGRVAVALVPIWGWGPSLGPGHLDPIRAAQAVARLNPQIAIPIHWGTYLPLGLRRTHGALLIDPAKTFAIGVAAHAPGTRLVKLAVGERLELPDPGAGASA